ncbi:MAG TPA: UvrD-helicase domain-containing protein [Acidobacteriaceae bacterium]
MAKVVSIQQASLFDFPPEPLAQPRETPAPQPTGPPDHAARLQALDVRRSFIVEAPAGSGKTGLLVQRFLKLLGDESVTRPEQVLAITFTVKATAEMRDRVLGHLEAARSNSEPHSDFDRQTRELARAVLERDRQLEWSLLDQPNRLQIRTIDSVCAEIARTLPVLSGSGGRLNPQQDGRPLYREAARRTLLLLGTQQSDPVFDAALSDLLLHRDGNLADCESLIADMLERRDQWGNLIPLAAHQLDDAWLDANVLPRLQHALEQAICTGLTQVARAFPPHILTDLTALASEMADSPGHNGTPSPIKICREFVQSPGCAAEDLEHWRALAHLLVKPSKPRDWRKAFAKSYMLFEMEKRHKARLVEIIASLADRPDLVELLFRISSLPPARYPANQWAVAKSLFRVLSRALVQLQFVFAERGECDFTEFTLLARAALTADSGPEDLASALGAKLQHLLVDEMQDTSAGQYELLRLLTATWDGHSQTVFLVGDPRQSIYLFRQARVESFLQTIETRHLGDLPLPPLRLTANFRSQQTLVGHFNRDFGLVFPEDSAAGSLPYSPADSVLPPSDYAEGMIWHRNPVEIRPALPLPAESLLTPAQLRQRQAKRDAYTIRRIIERWFQKPLPLGRTKPWQIAVLVRNRSHLIEITAEFDKHRPSRIPYRAVDIVPLSDRQEVLDLTALTRTLLHPADRVAALAILRAPWCGLSLADLHTLTGADDPTLRKLSIRRLMEQRGHLLPDESIERLKRVWTVLESAATQDSRLSAARLVERVWRSLGGDTWLTEAELSNARRFFRLLDQMEAEAGSSGAALDPNRLADRLQTLYAEPAPCPPDAPTVELLTVHRAKGIEWDVVLVPALERSPGANRPRLLTWSELEDASDPAGPAPILMAPIAAKGEEVDALTIWIKDIHKRREAAERKRLFYVASTRARQELHLFAAPDLTTRGDLNPRWDSLLKSAWTAARPQFDEWELARTGIVPVKSASAPVEEPAQPIVLDMAASAAPILRPPLQRLPFDFDPRAQLSAQSPKFPYGQADQATPSDALFARPEGSFAARSFGNAVHACLEILAGRIAAGQTPAGLLAELPAWTPRIEAILRADGLPRDIVNRLARETREALQNVLRDHQGLWLLAAHAHAANEFALTSWHRDITGQAAARPASVRVDRIFQAGAEPHAPGESHLWIVDYKTTAHGRAGLDEFLAEQRAAYAPQLESYARILEPAHSKSHEEVRLALYFPTLPRLIWWKASAPATEN